MKHHYSMMARYNAWANERLYAMAAALPGEVYRRDIGAFFKSLEGVLNHLLAADRIWLHRLTGSGTHPPATDTILFDDLDELLVARRAEDARLIAFIASVGDTELDEARHYRTLNGTPQQNSLGEILAHLFNHQTHHRGQAHALLTSLGVAEPLGLDLLIMLREMPLP